MGHSAYAVCVRIPGACLRTSGLIRFALFAAALSLAAFTPREAPAADPTRTFVGRAVGDVLNDLRSQGLTFIYNTRILPAELRVEREPVARNGLGLATEILAAHRLSVSQAAPGVYAVVAQEAVVRSPAEAPAAVRAGDATLEEVVVHTSRYALIADLGVSESLLTQEQVQNMPRLADEPLRAAQRLPGVASNGFSSFGPVRGGLPNETAIILDGLRLYEPFHLKNFLSPVSLLDSRLIQSMEIYLGGFPVPYGDRMSAMIDAKSVHPAQPRYYEAGLSLFHASALASATFADDRGRGLISARRSNIGDLAHYSEKDYGEPQYADGFMRLDYRFDDATRATFNALMSSDRITALTDSGRQRADAEYRNAYAWGTLEHDWSDRFSSRAILSYTDVVNERHGVVNDPARVGAVRDERNFHIIGLRVENELRSDAVEHRFGAEVRRVWGGYDYSSDVLFAPGFPLPDSPGARVQRAAAPKPDGFETSAYWDGRVDLGARWTIQSGLRFDSQTYDGSGDAAQWGPRLNVLYTLSDATRLRASWGRFFQAQGVNELQVEDGVDRFHQAQHADHVIVSLDHSLDAGLDLRIEAYRKDYRHTSPRFENLFNPLVLLPEIELDRVMIDPDSARAEGVEVLLRMPPRGSWSGWLGYSWSRAEDRIAGRTVKRSWDQTHAVNLGVAWAHGPWAVTLTDTFHTGWPITRLSLSTAADGAQQLIVGERNSERLDFYNSLDFRITRTFALSRGALDVFIEASNTLSRSNPCCIDYNITNHADGSVTLDQDLDSWLPLVPSAGVLWRY